MENKNLVLAIALSLGFMFLWTVFVVPRISPPPVPTVPERTTPQREVAGKPAVIRPGQPLAPRVEGKERPVEIFFRDSDNEIVLAPAGGGVSHWRLNLKGHEADLVLGPETEAPALSDFRDRVFEVSQKGRQAVLRATLENGIRYSKTLTLSPDGFLHSLVFRFENPTGQPVQISDWEWGWGPGIGTVPSEQKENSGMIRALTKKTLEAKALKPGEYPDMGQWAGIDNRYFMVAFLPPENVKPQLIVGGDDEKTTVRLRHQLTVPARGHLEVPYEIYAGPKGYTQLRQYGKGLEEGVDFGFFSALGKLILRALYFFQNWTGNYGWAIVVLTVILQILMLPLTLKSFKAALAMKKMQPQIAALQAKFKGDPKRLNVEMMNMYKKSGTNPFGGCLPLLLQLPIFWALFTTLRNAYELRGAPWIFWIKDLSAADPYRVLPIVMGAGMFLQQRMTGAVSDPMQRQMMYLMPVIFTVMFLNFPAGLVLYWLVQNILSIAFQYAFKRYTERNEPAAALTVH